MMTIRQMAEDAGGNLVTMPRLDWLAVLQKAVSDDPVVSRWITDLQLGAENTPAIEVMCERRQVLAVCDAAGE